MNGFDKFSLSIGAPRGSEFYRNERRYGNEMLGESLAKSPFAALLSVAAQ